MRISDWSSDVCSSDLVIPALLRRFHEAKLSGAAEVVIWGSGTPRREFLYSDDLADACLFLMTLDDARYSTLLGSRDPDEFVPPLVNIGYGSDVTIRELAEMNATVIGYEGRLAFEPSKPDIGRATCRERGCPYV